MLRLQSSCHASWDIDDLLQTTESYGYGYFSMYWPLLVSTYKNVRDVIVRRVDNTVVQEKRYTAYRNDNTNVLDKNERTFISMNLCVIC